MPITHSRSQSADGNDLSYSDPVDLLPQPLQSPTNRIPINHHRQQSSISSGGSADGPYYPNRDSVNLSPPDENYSMPIDFIKAQQSTNAARNHKKEDEIYQLPISSEIDTQQGRAIRPNNLEIRGQLNRPHGQRFG